VFGIGGGSPTRKATSSRNEWSDAIHNHLFALLPKSGVGVALLCNAEGAQDFSKLLDDIVSATFQ